MSDGAMTPEAIIETGHFLRSLQEHHGAFPWFREGQWDAWNHTETCMGLTVCGVVALAQGSPADTEAGEGFLTGAREALDHLRDTQRPDGSWPMFIRRGLVEHHESDTNQCAYPAVGVWHYALATGDDTVLERYWPMIEAAMEHVLLGQLPDGSIAWAINDRGDLGNHALLTGNASILQSLWAACQIARRVGRPRPAWTEAGNRLAAAVARRPELFAPRERYSMDWFYPILGGALTGEDARRHLEAQWERFIWDGHGVRCVDDHPWVTGGETAELVMALMCLIDTPYGAKAADKARALFRDIATLRAPGGGYWTGFVVPDDAVWPEEQTGWTAGAMLLAADALDQLTPASNFFHAMTWPQEVP